MRRHLLAQMVLVIVVASAIGIAIALWIDWFPTPASTQATKVDNLWDILLIVSVPIFVLVEVVVIFSVWKFRMKPGQELEDGPPIHGSTRLEVVWTTLPALLLLGLCTYTYVVLRQIEKPQKNTTTINVIGEQFTWLFRYPPTPAEQKLGVKKSFMTNQLYLSCAPNGDGPSCKGTPIKFDVQSRDVIHDFWVPNFRIKIDAVPGIVTSYRVTPDRLGDYPVVCAELCGIGHSTMRQTAHVITPAKYDCWRAKMQGRNGGPACPKTAVAGAKPGAATMTGKQIFTAGAQPPCASCHTLADAGSTGTTGPNLDNVLKGKDVAFIRQSIINPDAQLAPGFSAGIMPKTYADSLSPQELNTLVNYLNQVATK